MNLFTYSKFFEELFKEDYEQILNDIGNFILKVGPTLGKEYKKIAKKNIWIHKTSTISENVNILGPCIIMGHCIIENNAVIRENVIIGPNSHIGNSSEVKNSILIDTVKLPHFNYVGDSILGSYVHFGAGAIVSNYRLDHRDATVKRRKLGAFIGDYSEIGCNSVICPGTIIYKNVTVYPTVMVRGIIPESTIVKDRNVIVKKENRSGGILWL